MTIEQMKARKTELGLTSEMISKAAGVPLSTVQKIFGGFTKAPRKLTIEALEKVLKEEENSRDSGVLPYPETRLHTLEEYYALPDEQRVELIDGVIYDMSAPSLLHQKILAQLFLQFETL